MGFRSWLASVRERNLATVFAQFTSASGFYSFQFPRTWETSADGDVLVFESGTQVIHVSAFTAQIPHDFPEQLLASSFKTESPTSDLMALDGRGWKGIRRNYVDNSASPPRSWSAVVAYNQTGYIMVTWNASGNRKPDSLAFEHLVKTLTLVNEHAP